MIMQNPYESIKTAIIYGAGSGGAYCFRLLEEEGIKVKAFIDDFKPGEYLGKPIIKVEDVDKYEVDAYFIGTGHSFCRIFNYYEKLKNKVDEDKIYIHAKILNPKWDEELDTKESSYNHINSDIVLIDAGTTFGGQQEVVLKFSKIFPDLGYIVFSRRLAEKISETCNNLSYVNVLPKKHVKVKSIKQTIQNVKPSAKVIIASNTDALIGENLALWLHVTAKDICNLDEVVKLINSDKVLKAVSVSQPIADELVQVGIDKDKIIVIPNWIDIQKDLKPRKYLETRFKVGWVSRFEPEKGWRDLVEALKDTDIEVDFLSTGSDLPIAIKMKEEQNLKNMNFLGWVEDQIGYLKENVDVYVFTSHAKYEAFGLVQIEAMSVGLPVISHDIPASRYVLGEDGLFYKTPQELRDLIFKLKTDKKFYEDMSAYSVERVKEFSTEKAKERWYDLFRELGVKV